jgi:hypothetical protein
MFFRELNSHADTLSKEALNLEINRHVIEEFSEGYQFLDLNVIVSFAQLCVRNNNSFCICLQ